MDLSDKRPQTKEELLLELRSFAMSPEGGQAVKEHIQKHPEILFNALAAAKFFGIEMPTDEEE